MSSEIEDERPKRSRPTLSVIAEYATILGVILTILHLAGAI